MEELLGILMKEHKLYQKILKLLRKEQEILVSGETGELPSVLEELEKLTSEIQSLEERRRKIIMSLSISYNVPASDMSLTRLCELAEEPLSKKLSDLKAKMANTMEMVRNLNACIFYLSEKALEYSTKFLEIICASGSTYHPDGNLQMDKEALISRRV